MGSYVWLSDRQVLPQPGRGVVSFEAKATNDIHVSLNSSIGSTRSQEGMADSAPVYEVLIGGWRNTKSCIRKGGNQQATVSKRPASAMGSPKMTNSPGSSSVSVVIDPQGEFCKYWICIQDGALRVGKGDFPENEFLNWKDPQPVTNVSYVGFSSWDSPIQYRNVRISDVSGSLRFSKNIRTSLEYMDISNYRTLANSQALSDIILIAHSYDLNDNIRPLSIFAHKCILISTSKVFSDYLERHPETTKLELDALALQVIQAKKGTDSAAAGQSIRAYVNFKNIMDILTWAYGGKVVVTPEIAELAEFLEMFQLTKLIKKRKKDSLVMDSIIIERKPSYEYLLADKPFYDVELVVEDQILKCHKAVLSLSSEHFFRMFTNSFRESSQKQISLHDVFLPAFKQLLQYCYAHRVDIEDEEEAARILELSDRFVIPSLGLFTQEYLKNHLNTDNCCQILTLAQWFNSNQLHHACIRYIENNFQSVVASEGFLELDASLLLELILSDNILVTKEEQMYEAIMQWGRGTPEEEPHMSSPGNPRSEYVKRLLQCVRYPLIDKEFLENVVLHNEYFAEGTHLRERALKALRYIQDDNKLKEDAEIKVVHSGFIVTEDNSNDQPIRRRKGHNFVELIFSTCGDENGVFYHIGTQGKTQRWTNPHRSGSVKISCSSPVSRYTKPEVLVGRTFVTTNYTKGRPAWWSMDLINYRLICNYYSMQADGSDSTLTEWIFQGSTDGVTWNDLRVHTKECLTGASHQAWPVYGKNSSTAYRYFRVIRPGLDEIMSHMMPAPSTKGEFSEISPVSTPTETTTIALCGIELYGYLELKQPNSS